MTIEEFRQQLTIIAPGIPVIAPGDFPIVINEQGIWTVDLELSTKGTAFFLIHASFNAAKQYGRQHGFSNFVSVGSRVKGKKSR